MIVIRILRLVSYIAFLNIPVVLLLSFGDMLGVWSGCIAVDEPGELVMRLSRTASHESAASSVCRFVRIEIRIVHATTFIVLGAFAATASPPFWLENRTLLPLRVWQSGTCAPAPWRAAQSLLLSPQQQAQQRARDGGAIVAVGGVPQDGDQLPPLSRVRFAWSEPFAARAGYARYAADSFSVFALN